MLTLATLREGLGVSHLPCHIGDTEPALRRFCEPESKFDLGLWILIHPESKSNLRVVAFRDYMVKAIKDQKDLFAGMTK